MIKSYTDIHQSKKLAEILPLESADMYYREWKRMTKDISIAHVGSAGEKDLPCWSLVALLEVMPKIKGGKPIIALDDNYITYPLINDLHTQADNIIDACYNMIIKLKERNLLCL